MLLDHTRVPAGLSCASRTIAKADNKVLYANTWLWAVLISDMATELGRSTHNLVYDSSSLFLQLHE